ncbi:fibroblast growth factor 21 [Gouania willdenowi]|uniref:fibroblast growth factor 21 n=1 Tax=Gouania willdenowi TaxID=441366 RepID=UPI00105569B8|nr:fibroblast growth factor 21-like [Gouania willdenowi]
MYLHISQDGKVSGSESQSPNSLLLLKSVKPGHTVIQGQTSSLFLCVDRAGHLRGQSHYSEDECTFRELLLADGYTRFLSSHYGFPVSLASRRSTDLHSLPFTRFLPLRNALTSVSASATPPDDLRNIDVDSDDLFGMGLNSMISPHFSAEK